MLSFIYDSERNLVEVRESVPTASELEVLRKAGGYDVNRNDMSTLADAQRIAREAATATGGEYGAVDRGPSTSPRYDVIRMPQIGDPVSQSFNGDSYPAGNIASISRGHRTIMTDDGTVFTRRLGGAESKDVSGRWLVKGSCFVMSHGHRDRRNPHF